MIRNRFNGYAPDGRRLLFKGGGDSSAYYENLDQLYAKQGQQLDRLMAIQDRNVIPGYDRLSTEAQQAGGIDEQNAAAASVISGGRSEIAAQRAATERDLTSMGVNPNDRRFVGLERGNDVAGAATIAGAANQARQGVKNLGFAKRKDVVGMGMGVPGDASSQMAAMGSTAAQQIAGRNQQQAASQAGMSSLATLGTMALMMKDGGRVRRGYAKGGKVCGPKRGIRMAGGGRVGGFFQPVQPPAAPGGAPQPQGAGLNPTTAMIMARGVKGEGIGKKLSMIPENLNAKGGHLAANLGNLTGNEDLTRQGVEHVLTSRGLDAESAHNLISGPQGLSPAAPTGATQVGGVSGSTGLTTGAAGETGALVSAGGETGLVAGAGAGAELGGAAGAGLAAEGAGAAAASTTAAAGAGTSAAMAASAAMPWIGAGLAVASLLGADLFADGGSVKRKDMRAGGDVSGPGTGTSDSIPAHLSDGEYVLNAEAVRLVGEDRLDAINGAGLAARRGVRMADGGAVGSIADGIIRGLGISRQFEAQNQERELRGLQAEQARLGIESARRDSEEKSRRLEGMRGVEKAQAEWLDGRDPGSLNDNEVQAFRSMTASEMVKRRLLNPDQVAEQVGTLKKYADEGAFKAIQTYTQSGGDKAAAIAAFNRFGSVKDVTDIQVTPVKGRDGLPDQTVRVTRADGSSMDMTLSDLAIANGVGAPFIAQRKAAMEAEKTRSEVNKNDATAEYNRGRIQLERDIHDADNAAKIAAAGIRAGGAGTASAARAAAGEVKQWSKWQDDLNQAKTLPQVASVDGKGNPIMQGMNQVYQPDPAIAQGVRELARANRQQIEAARVDPEEFGQIGTAIIGAGKMKDPDAIYSALDQTGKLQIVTAKSDGRPIGAAIMLGTDPESGQPQLLRLPKSVEQAVIQAEFARRDKRSRTEYTDEGRRMGVPGVTPQKPAPRSAADRARQGVIPLPGQYSDADARRLLGG